MNVMRAVNILIVISKKNQRKIELNDCNEYVMFKNENNVFHFTVIPHRGVRTFNLISFVSLNTSIFQASEVSRII